MKQQYRHSFSINIKRHIAFTVASPAIFSVVTLA